MDPVSILHRNMTINMETMNISFISTTPYTHREEKKNLQMKNWTHLKNVSDFIKPILVT